MPQRKFGDADGFRTLRRAHRLSLAGCGKLLGVTGRTVSLWESGRVRVPYAPYRLLRTLLGARLPGEGWEGFQVVGDRLVSPEGHAFTRGDLAWLSLTFRQAEAFRYLYKQLTRQTEAGNGRWDRVVGASAAANEPRLQVPCAEVCALPCVSVEARVRAKAATVLETLYAGREGSIAAALRAAGYLRVTSAKQAGITDCVWTPEKIARLAD